MKQRLLAILLILAALAGSAAELHGYILPSISWFFSTSRDMAVLRCELPNGEPFYYFGWLGMLLLLFLGIWLLRRPKARLNSEAAIRWIRFRRIKRGYFAYLLLLGLMILAGLDFCLVGNRALAVEYQGKWSFPAFSRAIITGDNYGLSGAAADAETDYRHLASTVGQPGAPSRLIMPPIPYAPTKDTTNYPREALVYRNGILYQPNGIHPYDGQAYRLYPSGVLQLRLRYRDGLIDGQVQGWNEQRQSVYNAQYSRSQLLQDKYQGSAAQKEAFITQSSPEQSWIMHYHPSPPLVGNHLLGTTSQGADLVAYLYGGLQVNIKAVLIYIPIIYSIGLSMGMLMGYWGGKFDLITQRLIEIISQLPFIFVVMVLADFLPASMRGMLLMLVLIAAFGWIHMTYVVRSATLREKQRDYIAAARIMGASPWRIITRHILPNLNPIIVTLLPFSIASIILSLTSLDYLGFGLPDSYATWGRLLNDGLGKLSSPWMVSAAFGALVFTLLLVSLIGEAIREAFDPRKHSYYE